MEDNAIAVNSITEISNLTPDQEKQVQDIVSSINISDSQAVLSFGAVTQKNIASFADTAIANIRAKDGGEVGKLLTSLVNRIDVVDINSYSGASILARIPLLGGIFNSAKAFMAKFEKMSTQIESITVELDKHQMTLMRDIKMLDILYGNNEKFLGDLDVYIAAGKRKIEDVKINLLPGLELKAATTKDPMDSQRYNDTQQKLVRFERKIDNLMRTRVISIQNAPQIRLMQNTDEALAEKLQDSILTVIPIWKSQIVIYMGSVHQAAAVKLQKDFADKTNEMLVNISEALKTTQINAATEIERGIVDIESLKKVNANLIDSIKKTIEIQAKGAEARVQAEKDYVQMKNELQETLLSAK